MPSSKGPAVCQASLAVSHLFKYGAFRLCHRVVNQLQAKEELRLSSNFQWHEGSTVRVEDLQAKLEAEAGDITWLRGISERTIHLSE